jgi:hypothetical protein
MDDGLDGGKVIDTLDFAGSGAGTGIGAADTTGVPFDGDRPRLLRFSAIARLTKIYASSAQAYPHLVVALLPPFAMLSEH